MTNTTNQIAAIIKDLADKADNTFPAWDANSYVDEASYNDAVGDYEFHISEAQAKLEALLLEAQIKGMEQAKSRVLRRTEIPKDAKNPTRDATVILGEQIADIIDGDIAELNQLHQQLKEREG